MQAILSYEFLIASAMCDKSEIVNLVEELILVSRLAFDLTNPPIIEQNALEKMIAVNYFPSDKIFSSVFSKIDDCPFSAKDVSRIVHSILSKARNIADECAVREVEWHRLEYTPVIGGLSQQREKEVGEILECMLLSLVFDDLLYNYIHFCNAGVSVLSPIHASGFINDVFPVIEKSLPLQVDVTLPVYRNYSSYLKACSAEFFYDRAQHILDVKFSCYVGAVALLFKNGSYKGLDWESFFFCERFLDTMKENQCMPGDRFGNVLFDVIQCVLAGCPKNEVKEFKESENCDNPIIRSGYTAYRTHVTKSGVALRLMFWKNEKNVIRFANVAPKAELEIEPL